MKAGIGALVHRLISIADEGTDDDDLRLRKRGGVVAGYIIGVGALLLPGMAQGLPLSWGVALTMFASRMESSGVPGRIQVAPSTWELLRESAAFTFEAREPIEVKGLGPMTTYLLVDG